VIQAGGRDPCSASELPAHAIRLAHMHVAACDPSHKLVSSASHDLRKALR
jgi:hypothetical protein